MGESIGYVPSAVPLQTGISENKIEIGRGVVQGVV